MEEEQEEASTQRMEVDVHNLPRPEEDQDTQPTVNAEVAEVEGKIAITTEGVEQDQEGSLFQCSHCEKEFGRQCNLSRHLENCQGEREIFQCTRCTSTFNRKDSLSRHVSTQHGVNPRRFKCTVEGCDKDFNRKDHLNKHLRGVHKIEPVSPTKTGGGGASGDDYYDSDGGDFVKGTPMITGVSSLSTSQSGVSHQDKRFKCSSDGCDAEYSNLDHLHRHVSRGHNSEMTLSAVLGHSIFGDSEMITAGFEDETTLCMFCCSTFQHSEEFEKQRKSALAGDPHFTKFCEAALRQQRKRMNANSIVKSLNSLQRLSVCQKCFNKIGYAMGTKAAADEVEARVGELRRQLDMELKNLASEVDQFYVEMKSIEATIRNSDMSSLEGYLKDIVVDEDKEQSSVVLLLRDGIFAVMNDVEIYCQRIGGQQVVVSVPEVKRSTTSSGGGNTGRKGRVQHRKKRKSHKSKSAIDPLLHVKIEHTKGGDDSEPSPSDLDEKNTVKRDGETRVKNNLPIFDADTPRRQPVREARVRTEEFLKSLFEKQLVGDDELDAVIKTEALSDTEEAPEGTPVTDDINLGTCAEAGKDSGDKGEAEKVTTETKENDSASTSAKPEDDNFGEANKTVSGEGVDNNGEGKGEPPPIEEILIEGDEFEDLFSVDGETSDEDFNLDATHDDFDSRSESSESESEDDDTEDSSGEEDMSPPAKKARGKGGRRGGRRPTKSDYDPFNFKKTKKSSKSSKTKSNNKIATVHNIDMTFMSEFRKRLLCRILKKNSKSKDVSIIPDADPTGEPDPRVNFQFEYNAESSTLLLGDVPVIIHDDHSSLQCSKCGYLSSPAEKPRRSVPRIMYNHILGKHLYAFQCPQCSATLGSYRRYLDHIKGHQMGFMCDICGKPLFSEEALRRHKWGHQNADEMAEAIRQGIKDPRRKHDPNQTFQCTTCGKVFAKKMLLRQHEKTHAENRERIVCTLCGKTFLPSGFISHQKYSCFPEGYEPPRVQCQICPSTFKSVVLRARHMKYAHSTASVEKPFKCHICGKGFAANEHLQKHIKRHSDARPYLCRKGCGANYKTRKDCTRHEKKCEGNGTPMMRHKGRNDQLHAAQVPKQEPHQAEPHPDPILEIQHQASPSTPVVLHVQQQGQPQHPQQFNVYNIL